MVLEQQSRQEAGGVQHKAVHLALSTLGLQFPQSGPGFMGSFSASPLLSLRLFWKAKVKLKTMTEQIKITFYERSSHCFGKFAFLHRQKIDATLLSFMVNMKLQSAAALA